MTKASERIERILRVRFMEISLTIQGLGAKLASKTVRSKAVTCAEIAGRGLDSEDLEEDVPGDRPGSRIFGGSCRQNESMAGGERGYRHEECAAGKPGCWRRYRQQRGAIRFRPARTIAATGLREHNT